MSSNTDSTRSAAEDTAAVPLDLLLGDAATGMLRRMNPGGSGLRLAAALAARPRLVAERGGQLAGELARIAVGRSQVEPSRRDRRFTDPGWAGNPLLRRTMQAYLAGAESMAGVVAEAGLDDADAERVGFVLTNLIDALSPSNNPLLNPAAVKARWRACGISWPIWRCRPGCRPWSSRTRSKSAWTWPSRPGR
jgi:polyhydroxyalkanoate synthase